MWFGWTLHIKSVPDLAVVPVDESLQICSNLGAKYFPWTPVLVEQAEAEKKARTAEVRSKIKISLEACIANRAVESNIWIGKKIDSLTVVDRLNALD